MAFTTATLRYNIIPTGSASSTTLSAAFAAVPLPVDLFNKIGLVLTGDSMSGTSPVVRTLTFSYESGVPSISAALLPGSHGAPVGSLTLISKGNGLAEPPTITFTPQPGDAVPLHPAQATCTLDVNTVTIIDGGLGYTGTLTAVPVGGLGPGGVAAVFGTPTTGAGNSIATVPVVSKGSGYTAQPLILIVGSTGGAGALAVPSMEINALALLYGGSGYDNAPSVSTTPGYLYRYPAANNLQGPLANLLTNYFETQLSCKVFAPAPTFS
jgi:hypothetical protein